MKKYKLYYISIVLLIVLVVGASLVIKNISITQDSVDKNISSTQLENISSQDLILSEYESSELQQESSDEPELITKEVLISFAGDCTIGSDDNFGYEGSFHQVYKQKGATHFFNGVRSVFQNDDYTFVNFEGTLTKSTDKNEKTYNFKGPKEYVEILKDGNVEGVTLANNHSYDYNEQGFQDTKEAITEAGIDYCFGDDVIIEEINGVKFGFIGFSVFQLTDSKKERILSAIKILEEAEVDVKIANFHWGIERDYIHSSEQQAAAYFAIDNGIDLVIGHHPHVLQGIETYKGKNIVYSLGNFVFGGNRNPSDKDSMIYQQKFIFENGELVSNESVIIPVSISSVSNRNDYQPTILEGSEKQRVLEKIKKDCVNFDYFTNE